MTKDEACQFTPRENLHMKRLTTQAKRVERGKCSHTDPRGTPLLPEKEVI